MTEVPTTDLFDHGPSGLVRLFEEMGEPSYRARQLMQWVYGLKAQSFAEITVLPRRLRDRLASEVAWVPPELVERQVSRDGTRKYLWRFGDGVSVESVAMPSGKRLTVCFSTQAGCAMGCAFCATGRSGFERDLRPGEMAMQVALAGRDLGQRVTNAVAMGQGEPFAAYEATLEALRLMNSPDGLGIGARHLTVSTCGIVPAIERFASEPEQYTLAVSLHSAVQETRDRLMPAMRAHPLARLRAALVAYATASGRRPTLEYALIEGVNDSPKEAAALAEFCRGMLCHVNLIPANPVEGADFERAGREAVLLFEDVLRRAGVEVSVRVERGADIAAACGQLKQRASADGG
ncbi:MAG: 23S rRNA (adenine(2503)-C(2))-methyltransferase RlmN [Coriobacteriia bacterium]